jgi:hypothetical protein
LGFVFFITGIFALIISLGFLFRPGIKCCVWIGNNKINDFFTFINKIRNSNRSILCNIILIVILRKVFQPVPATLRARRLKLKTLFHQVKHKICPAPNNDGRFKCLRQPGQLGNQPPKSILLTSTHLLNFMYQDSSCCLDKF